MTTLIMPQLSGSRRSARALTESLPKDHLSGTVVLDATPMEAASQSYADELVLSILASGRAAKFEVHGATDRFAQHLNTSARVRGVSDRICVTARA